MCPEEGDKPALQVIVLGSGGGPIEHNTTALLVRSIASGWRRGSVVAVDAGVHLGAIARILEDTQPEGLGTKVPLPHLLESGPFAGLEVSTKSAISNAAHITQSLIDTYLITHPHLDHISGFIVNTAGFNGNRPKRLAGLPSTIAAFKTHIFNNVIWPNLSDENNGAGLVTYTRLVDGGSPAIGEGEGQGYLEISDGLSVKTWSVSHGHCIERHSHRGSQSSQGERFGSADFGTVASPRIITTAPTHSHPHSHNHSHAHVHGGSGGTPMSRVSSLMTQAASQATVVPDTERICVYDSSAYFIRDVATGREVLIFGDVEPDTISLSPKNLRVWQEAAPKIASGLLNGIFVECSYDDSQSDERLFGHLKPYHLVEELRVLAHEVELVRHGNDNDVVTFVGGGAGENRKRKRDDGADDGVLPVRRRSAARVASPFGGAHDEPVSPKSSKPAGKGLPPVVPPPPQPPPEVVTPTSEAEDPSGSTFLSQRQEYGVPPLAGLKVVIIHVKEKLTDGPPLEDVILEELKEYEDTYKLGCEFIISEVGQSVMI